jgi:hypothetical protein
MVPATIARNICITRHVTVRKKTRVQQKVMHRFFPSPSFLAALAANNPVLYAMCFPVVAKVVDPEPPIQNSSFSSPSKRQCQRESQKQQEEQEEERAAAYELLTLSGKQ